MVLLYFKESFSELEAVAAKETAEAAVVVAAEAVKQRR